MKVQIIYGGSLTGFGSDGDIIEVSDEDGENLIAEGLAIPQADEVVDLSDATPVDPATVTTTDDEGGDTGDEDDDDTVTTTYDGPDNAGL